MMRKALHGDFPSFTRDDLLRNQSFTANDLKQKKPCIFCKASLFCGADPIGIICKAVDGLPEFHSGRPPAQLKLYR
jgi:hypothetical protein